MTWERINLCTQYLNDLMFCNSNNDVQESISLYPIEQCANWGNFDQFNLSVNSQSASMPMLNINLDPQMFNFGNQFLSTSLQVPALNVDFNNLFQANLSKINPSAIGFQSSPLNNSSSGTLGQQFATKALSYKNKVNTDYEGNKLFSPRNADGSVKTNWSWCVDFVTKNMQDIYGNKLPSGYRVSGCTALISWADHNNCYRSLKSTSASQKQSVVKTNLKVGDIVFTPGRGASGLHAGIVTSVNYETGAFETVSGNSGNKVKTSNKKPSDVLGFISMGKFSA